MSHKTNEFILNNPADPPSDPVEARNYWIQRGIQAESYGHPPSVLGNLFGVKKDPETETVERLQRQQELENPTWTFSPVVKAKQSASGLLDGVTKGVTDGVKTILVYVVIGMLVYVVIRYVVPALLIRKLSGKGATA